MAMLEMMAQQGITEVVATPHFYPQRTTPERFLKKRNASWEKLREQMELEKKETKIRLGAEVFYYDQMSHSEELRKLAIQGTNAILIEMPLTVWTDRMYRELEKIHDNLDLMPIVAHVDRYLGRFRDYGIPERLEQMPVLVQANASFFLRTMSASRGLRMLSREQIHLLGSDCHNMKDRKPNLGPAIELIRNKRGQKAIDQICKMQQTVFLEPKKGSL